MLESLCNILSEMKKNVQNDDWEDAHSKADELLISLIEIISENHEYNNISSKIIEEYMKVGKWYA